MTTPKADCQTLLNAALPRVEELLQKNGEFFPVGAVLRANGEIRDVAAYDGREQPPSADIIRLLKQAFVEGARSGDYVATALLYDVRVSLPSTNEKSDAIAVALDHRDHYSVIVFFPYQLAQGELSFGEVFAQQGTADIFKAT